MKYPRVNLLNKSEQRYQGVVSRRFLLVCLVVTPILFITVLSGIKLIQYSAVKADLKTRRNLWVSLEPRLNLYQSERKCMTGNKRAIELIESWQEAQVPVSTLLDEIQDSVPENIRLSRLAIRSELVSPVYEKPEDFTLEYTLTVQGLAVGDRAEDTVIDLRKNLLKPELMGATFNSIKLGSMRKRASNNEESMREFSMEGTGVEGEEE